MSDATALIRTIMGEFCPDESSAIRLLDRALELEVDPLDYCAATLGMGEAHVMERGALHGPAWILPRLFPPPLTATWRPIGSRRSPRQSW